MSLSRNGSLVYSRQAALVVGLVAVALPLAVRVLSSPVTLLLISPFLLILAVIACLIFSTVAGYILDTHRVVHRNALLHAARPFAFSTPAAWQAVLTRSQWSHKSPQSLPPLFPDMPVLSASMNDVMILIVRDFVLTWYKDLSTSPSFPMAVSSLLYDSAGSLATQLSSIDIPTLVVKRILPKVTAHVEQFRRSEVALRGAGLERKLTQSEELDMLLASRYSSKGENRLHQAVDNLSSTFTRQSEEMHLRGVADRILACILPERDGQSRALRIVVREIVACAVLYPLMDMIADPDFWNRTIDQVAGAAIHQQKLISKVRNVLEAQSPRSHGRMTSSAVSAAAPSTEFITIHTDHRQFESFLRSINRCSSLLDARRLKNDITGEIRRTRSLLADHENDEWINGERTEDVVAFLDRLYTAKRQAERRIVVLGGEKDPRPVPLQDSAIKSRLTLREVLGNPTSLSYFMEFMDRRHRSLLVQFWLTVESFKNPLESVDSSSSGDEDDPIQDTARSNTLKEDMSMMNDLYFSSASQPPALSSISKKYVDDIRSFARNELTSSPAIERRVRRSVMLAQRQVEREMEQDFDDFERSELWFRVVEDFELSGRGTSKSAPSSPPASISPPKSASLSPISRTGGFFSPKVQRSDSAPSFNAPALDTKDSRPTLSMQKIPQVASPLSASRSNIEMLMSPISDVASEMSRAPLFDENDDVMPRTDDSQRMEAIQAALTNIIATDEEQRQKPRIQERDSDDLLNSSHLAAAGKRRGVFDEDDDDIDVDDEERMDESADNEQGSFQLAGPGDLQLSYEIGRLEDKISHLETQEVMLDTLIKKAELTGDTQELRLLRRSKSSMNRELRQLRFQKLQYQQQETANRLLSHRTKVTIVNSTVGEEEGKSVVRYLIEVQQLAPDGTFASGWVVARRYNEFLTMHNKLRERYLMVKSLDFPGKRLVTSLSSSFVDNRRQALEKYMQNLIAIPVICESNELRTFLSRESPFMASATRDDRNKAPPPFSGKNLVRTMYRSVAESLDDMFFGPSMLDVMIQRLTRQAAEFTGIAGTAVHDEELVAQALRAYGKATSEETFMNMSGDLKPLEGETSSSTFSAPICDLVLAIFELDKKNNWLRRQAIVIILQQVLGDTIERKLRESVKSMYEESRLLSLITMFRDSFWQGGKLKPHGAPRTNEEKLRSRDEANRKLSALVPDLAANMIGRTNARRGARRIFAVLQNRRLNQHIAYTILDEIVAAFFPQSAA